MISYNIIMRFHFNCTVVAILMNFISVVFAISREDKYSSRSQCLDRLCFRRDVGRARSRIECGVICSFQSSCVGFFYPQRGACTHLHERCYFNVTCPNNELPLIVYQKRKVCKNDGQWNEQLQNCSCSDGWVGDRCERKPYNCRELTMFGYTPGTYRVSLDVFQNQTRLVYTQCAISETYWHTFIFANDGTESQNRTYKKYITGFDHGRWNIWLGLDNILAFNRMGHSKIALIIVVQPGNNFVWEYGYTNFSISDASSGYSFTCNYSYNTTYGGYAMSHTYYPQDIIGMSQGHPFSSFDFDQDDDNQNCAASYGAGWWFSSCSNSSQYVNPLGINPMSSPTPQGMSKMLLPGINTDDAEVMGQFQSIAMLFLETI